ncbi:MAG: hypothetical protein JXJ04_18530 [Spirochaetales bacterium]|nr:hypothetical protein [Spirochaetales bacterium]
MGIPICNASINVLNIPKNIWFSISLYQQEIEKTGRLNALVKPSNLEYLWEGILTLRRRDAEKNRAELTILIKQNHTIKILRGPNGSGKTAVVDALVTLLVPPFKRHYNYN